MIFEVVNTLPIHLILVINTRSILDGPGSDLRCNIGKANPCDLDMIKIYTGSPQDFSKSYLNFKFIAFIIYINIIFI